MVTTQLQVTLRNYENLLGSGGLESSHVTHDDRFMLIQRKFILFLQLKARFDMAVIYGEVIDTLMLSGIVLR